VLFITYCLAVWYGSRLIFNQEVNRNKGKIFSGGDVFKFLLSAIVSRISLGSKALNLKAISEAKVAASDLFQLIHRKPVINTSKSTE
jgi:hypothetical protein